MLYSWLLGLVKKWQHMVLRLNLMTLELSHLDVSSASAKHKGWINEPFMMVEKDGKLYGRGTSDGKGPSLGWLHAIEAYQNTKTDLPVNLKFIYVGTEKSDKWHFEHLLKKKKMFLEDVTYICVSDSTWLDVNKPSIPYGMRGFCFFHIEISCAKKDLHSGHHGGSVLDPISDLMYLLNRLVDLEGNIIIPGAYDDVEPVTPEEEKMYENIDYDVIKFQEAIGCQKLKFNDKAKFLMSRWRFPCLSIHGVEGTNSKDGFKTILPKKVIGKFSIHLVPNQEPEKISKLVIDYLDKLWIMRRSPNTYKAYLVNCGKPWISSIHNENYKAAWRATKHAYDVEPDMIRDGRSIPVTALLQELTSKNVVMLPLGAGDDDSDTENEKIDVQNLICGTKLMAAYLYEIAQ
ncbi:cytosolic non-specific dipeptidase-like [Lycorma delicatula]|uniref:cytosolic non-specific dipeptidase-like n=1 Tax=Lycorma delicatula TaxID=130591 RepID=UPI003F510C5B